MPITAFIRNYGGMIWTDHALWQLKRRKIFQSDALAVLRHPDRTIPGKKENSVKFMRKINERLIQVVATLNENKKWVVMSAWVRGEEDPQPMVVRVSLWVFAHIKNLITFKKIG